MITEIEQILTAPSALPRIRDAATGPIRRRRSSVSRPANARDMLDLDVRVLGLRHELVKERIDNDAHRQRLDGRRLERLGGREGHRFSSSVVGGVATRRSAMAGMANHDAAHLKSLRSSD